MPLDPQFAESVKPHRGCPAGRWRGRDARLVGKMARLYRADPGSLRWVPVGVLCLDCGAVEIHYRPRAESPGKPPPR